MIDLKRGFAAALLATTLGSTALSKTPEPNPDDLFAVINWVLEKNGCTATESQIYNAILSRSDRSTANMVIVNWGEDPNFSRAYRSETGADGGVVYTMISGPRCGG